MRYSNFLESSVKYSDVHETAAAVTINRIKSGLSSGYVYFLLYELFAW